MKKKEWKERMTRIFLGGGESGNEGAEAGEATVEEIENRENNQNEEENADRDENDRDDDRTADSEESGRDGEGDGDDVAADDAGRADSESANDGDDTGGAKDDGGDVEGPSAGTDQGADEDAGRDSFERNLSESILRLEGYRSGRGISKEEFDEALKMIIGITEKCRDGIIDIETIEFAVKGVSADRLEAQARLEGEIAGRNAGIAAWLDRSADSDGLPAPGNAAVAGSASRTSIFSLADEAR